MKNMYEVGKVYVWQNLVLDSHLNGQETTVITDAMLVTGRNGIPTWEQGTDTKHKDGRGLTAGPGKLRPKNPPPGELSVLEMFKAPLPELEPA